MGGVPKSDHSVAAAGPVLPRSNITRAEHVAFALCFGDLEDHPVGVPRPGHPFCAYLQIALMAPISVMRTLGTPSNLAQKPPVLMRASLHRVHAGLGPTPCGRTWPPYERLPDQIQTRIAQSARSPQHEATSVRHADEKRLALKAQFPGRGGSPVVRAHSETGEKFSIRDGFTTHFTNFHTAGTVRCGQDYARHSQLLQYLSARRKFPVSFASVGSRTCGVLG